MNGEEQATEQENEANEHLTVTGAVEAVSQRENRYGIRIGDDWYGGFGVCPVSKGQACVVDYVVRGPYRNIVRVQEVGDVVAHALSVQTERPLIPVAVKNYLTPEGWEQAFMTAEEERLIQDEVRQRNARVLLESMQDARNLLAEMKLRESPTSVVRSALLLAERRAVHVSRVFDQFMAAKVAAVRRGSPSAAAQHPVREMRALPAPTARTASGASPFSPGDDKNQKEASDVDDPFKRELVFSYTDEQAVDDGMLKRFMTPRGRDTRHRITTNAYEQLTEHHKPAYPQYTEADFMRFYLNELLALVPEAVRVYERNIGGGILKTDYDFRVTKATDDVLWYIPNEIGGITMMKPEDY